MNGETGVTGGDTVLDPAFWTRRFSALSVCRSTTLDLTALPRPHDQSLERIRERIMTEGYFGDADPELATPARALAGAATTCVELGLPPLFVFMFDEAWACFFRLHAVLSFLLGPEYRFLPDFWAWHVDPSRNEAGWKPHRDKGRQALAPDGSPLSLTVWIPLSEANPLNSCIYVVPANADPTYGRPEEKILHVVPTRIRALPAKPGEYLCWNQAVYHWGSPSSPFATEPRISMALECQRGDAAPFNTPLLEARFPGFGLRQRLIAKQILQYQHMYDLPPALREIALQMQQRHDESR